MGWECRFKRSLFFVKFKFYKITLSRWKLTIFHFSFSWSFSFLIRLFFDWKGINSVQKKDRARKNCIILFWNYGQDSWMVNCRPVLPLVSRIETFLNYFLRVAIFAYDFLRKNDLPMLNWKGRIHLHKF